MKTALLISLLFLTTLLTSCLTEYDRADFLLPSNVTKDFAILLGEECGQEILIINGRKQYQIKQNGFLVVQNEFKNLPIDYRFYKVVNGIKKELEINYYRKEDGRPYPGVRITGHFQIKENLEKPIDGISFRILYSEKDKEYDSASKEKEQDYLAEVMKCRDLNTD